MTAVPTNYAATLIRRIKLIGSFDKLNLLTASVDMGAFSPEDRQGIEAAIKARREYLARIAGTP